MTSRSDWLRRVAVPYAVLAAGVLGIGILGGGLFGVGTAVAQPLANATRIPSLVDACREGSSQRAFWLLNAASLSQPYPPAARASFDPIRQAAYRLFEEQYVPYRDPQMASTWKEKPYAILQPSLGVDVVADSLFRMWDAAGYPLDASWNAPPVLYRVDIDDFRPRLSTDEFVVLYARPEIRADLLDLLLPSGLQRASETRRRVACVEPVVGLTDWVRTSNDAHSPPEMNLTLNVSRTRAIAGYGWGSKGGVWVLYRRPSPDSAWTEVRPIGAWTYEQ